eukprot:TRINITY_DN1476_c0_g1_i2.p1 TRINITY_DN1476_c0_g1~~TRINITY_DN1476_c0_g1_i2.p1  ORF type:complete len:848 (-),score=297.50 TRINITY_DN1476_c0_g1_i2:417-2849(-)
MQPLQALLLAALLWLAARLVRRAWAPAGGGAKAGVEKSALSAAAAAVAAGASPREAQLVADTWEFAPEAELPAGTAAARVLILYATEYGFSKDVARRVAAALATGTIVDDGGAAAAAAAAAFDDDAFGDEGGVGSSVAGLREAVSSAAGPDCVSLLPRVVNMADWRAVSLAREAVVLVVMSTTGDGVVPSEAAELKEALEADGVGALRLDVKRAAAGGAAPLPRYSVLALGDRGYPHFCRGGIIMEELLDQAIAAAAKSQAAIAAPGVPSVNSNGVVAAGPPPAALASRQDVDQEDWVAICEWLSRVVASLSDMHRAGHLPTVMVGGGGDGGGESIVGVDMDTSGDDVDYLVDAVRAYAAEEERKGAAGDGDVPNHYSRIAPLMAAVSGKTLLTVPTAEVPDGDRKEVVRVVFDTSGSSLAYTAGDALGIVPHNDPATVAGVLVALAADGGEEVGAVGSGASGPGGPAASGAGGVSTLREALTTAVDLKAVRPELLAAIARVAHAPAEQARAAALAASPPDLTAYTSDREVPDVLADFPSAALSPRELLKALRPLHARYYSVSSSPVTSPTAVAITVDVLRYTLRGVPRKGVASAQLAERVAAGDRVGIFIAANAHFRLPPTPSTPIIMVGPGTGVAPFVGFLDERRAAAAAGGGGRNLLFTGCRHERQDYLYGAELSAAAAAGEVEVYPAFSRDGPSKVYVQHRMAEAADDLWALVDAAGAHVYVCGDATRMAGDVHAAWLAIIRRGGVRRGRGGSVHGRPGAGRAVPAGRVGILSARGGGGAEAAWLHEWGVGRWRAACVLSRLYRTF